MDSDDIKSCPFCGSHNLDMNEETAEDEVIPARAGMFIFCLKCGAGGPKFKRPTHDEEIIPAWNYRPYA